MTEKNEFDSRKYQSYVDEVQGLVAKVAQNSQGLLEINANYINESCKSYGDHVTALMGVKSPQEYFTLNAEFLQSSSSRFQRLLQKRQELFVQLSNKLSEKNNLLFLFPQSIQDGLNKFRENGRLNLDNNEAWIKFGQVFLAR